MTATEAAIAPDGSEERRRPRTWLEAPRRTVLLFAALFIAAEAVGAFVNISIQAALDATFAFVAINIGIFGYRTKRTAGLVMAALFTQRLVVLTLPATGIAPTTRIGIIAVIGVVVAYIATWVLGIDITSGRSDEGFALRPPLVSRSFTSALTILSGFPIGWLAYEALTPDKLVVQTLAGSTAIPWAVAIGALILGAFGEELIYRRLVAAMVQHTGQSQTPWVSGALYGAAFLATHNVAMIALMTATGALFAWSCERTGSIKPVVTAHAIASVLVFVVLAH